MFPRRRISVSPAHRVAQHGYAYAYCLIFLILTNLSFASIDLHKVVEAIQFVENSQGVGAAGEVSPWQFMPSTWKQYSSKPLAWATRTDQVARVEQRRVALAHAKWIVDRLPKLGLPETAYSVGLVWNAGYGNVRDRRITSEHSLYAQRVRAVYDN